MGFEYLKTLQDKLAKLKSALSGHKSELKVQKDRKEDIEEIITNIKNVSNDRTDDVNSCLNKLIENYDDALKGCSSTTSLDSATSGDKEEDSFSDSQLSEALTELRNELNAVVRKISELEGNVSTESSQITSCESSIRTEKRNIALDYQNRLNNAQAKVNRLDAALRSDPENASLRQQFNQACSERDAARSQFNQYRGWL